LRVPPVRIGPCSSPPCVLFRGRRTACVVIAERKKWTPELRRGPPGGQRPDELNSQPAMELPAQLASLTQPCARAPGGLPPGRGSRRPRLAPLSLSFSPHSPLLSTAGWAVPWPPCLISSREQVQHRTKEEERLCGIWEEASHTRSTPFHPMWLYPHVALRVVSLRPIESRHIV
jgi:hypothetical protein